METAASITALAQNDQRAIVHTYIPTYVCTYICTIVYKMYVHHKYVNIHSSVTTGQRRVVAYDSVPSFRYDTRTCLDTYRCMSLKHPTVRLRINACSGPDAVYYCSIQTVIDGMNIRTFRP